MEVIVVLPIVRKAEKWIHTLSRTLYSLGLIILLLMTFLVVIDVFLRYLFKSPIAGSTDILQMMMLVLVYSGFAYCASVDGNVRIDVLYGRLPEHIQAYLDIITSMLSVLIVALITWRLGARAWEIYLNPPSPVTDYFQWPIQPFIVFASAGAGFLCLELLIWFFRSINRTRSS
jgi:TRAP-type C4-dicarboxylate transport system permease small subunit